MCLCWAISVPYCEITLCCVLILVDSLCFLFLNKLSASASSLPSTPHEAPYLLGFLKNHPSLHLSLISPVISHGSLPSISHYHLSFQNSVREGWRERNGRDQKNLSRAESPMNTGLTADDGRDETFCERNGGGAPTRRRFNGLETASQEPRNGVSWKWELRGCWGSILKGCF